MKKSIFLVIAMVLLSCEPSGRKLNVLEGNAIGTTFSATNLIYYFIREPSMSHVLSMFAVSLFLYLNLRDFGKKTPSTFIFSGLAAGLMILIRYQNALFMIVPFVYNIKIVTIYAVSIRFGMADHRE